MAEEYNFKGQLQYETFQFFFRQHWVRFLQSVLLTLPVAILMAFGIWGLGQLVLMTDNMFLRSLYVFSSLIILAIFLHTTLLHSINYYFRFVLVTNCRILIVYKTVFLKNNADAIDLTKIQDIGGETQGIIRNYLRYGNLLITLSTSAPPLDIGFVPDPHFYLEWLNRVKREHILERQEKRMTGTKTPLSLAEKRSEYLQDISGLSG